MMWDNNLLYFQEEESYKGENNQGYQQQSEEDEENSHLNFDYLSLISKPKDYYRILEVDYDASEEEIRSNFIRLALKWHPDKQKNQDDATIRFQEINEAYQVLSDPDKRQEYDQKGVIYAYDYNIFNTSTAPMPLKRLLPKLGRGRRRLDEYLNRYKSLILTCNGLGMNCSLW